MLHVGDVSAKQESRKVKYYSCFFLFHMLCSDCKGFICNRPKGTVLKHLGTASCNFQYFNHCINFPGNRLGTRFRGGSKIMQLEGNTVEKVMAEVLSLPEDYKKAQLNPALLAAGGHLPIRALRLQALSSGIRKPWENMGARSGTSCHAPGSSRLGASRLHCPSCGKGLQAPQGTLVTVHCLGKSRQ